MRRICARAIVSSRQASRLAFANHDPLALASSYSASSSRVCAWISQFAATERAAFALIAAYRSGSTRQQQHRLREFLLRLLRHQHPRLAMLDRLGDAPMPRRHHRQSRRPSPPGSRSAPLRGRRPAPSRSDEGKRATGKAGPAVSPARQTRERIPAPPIRSSSASFRSGSASGPSPATVSFAPG